MTSPVMIRSCARPVVRGFRSKSCCRVDAKICLLLGVLLTSPAILSAQPATTVSNSTLKADNSRVTALPKAFLKPAPNSVGDLREMEQHVKEVSRKVMPFTVALQVGQAMGSGVIVSKDGYILTAAHVISRPNREVNIILSDGRRYKGRTLGVIKGTDAGLVKFLQGENWPHAAMGDDAKAKTGTWCLALGHPNGYQRGRPPVVRLGRMVGRRPDTLHTDCTLVGGDSGGPLFDASGAVIGIHSRIGKFNTRNYHVPVNEFKDRWEDLVSAKVFE